MQFNNSATVAAASRSGDKRNAPQSARFLLRPAQPSPNPTDPCPFCPRLWTLLAIRIHIHDHVVVRCSTSQRFKCCTLFRSNASMPRGITITTPPTFSGSVVWLVHPFPLRHKKSKAFAFAVFRNQLQCNAVRILALALHVLIIQLKSRK